MANQSTPQKKKPGIKLDKPRSQSESLNRNENTEPDRAEIITYLAEIQAHNQRNQELIAHYLRGIKELRMIIELFKHRS